MNRQHQARSAKNYSSAKSSNNASQVLIARNALILGGRSAARKLAGKLLKTWHAYLPQDEIESLCNLALCEAASRFDPQRGTNFLTYLFFYIRGLLIREFQSRSSAHPFLSEVPIDNMPLADAAGDSSIDPFFEEAWINHNPEEEAHERFIRRNILAAIFSLKELERRVVLEVFYDDGKVAKIARKLGYSRGHLSDVKTTALRKLREHLVDFKDAA